MLSACQAQISHESNKPCKYRQPIHQQTLPSSCSPNYLSCYQPVSQAQEQGDAVNDSIGGEEDEDEGEEEEKVSEEDEDPRRPRPTTSPHARATPNTPTPTTTPRVPGGRKVSGKQEFSREIFQEFSPFSHL